MKTAYDEVVKQPCDKLAQTMQDMTYCYNETVVPKKHYKKLLTKQLEEVVADSVAVNMVNTVLVQSLLRESASCIMN